MLNIESPTQKENEQVALVNYRVNNDVSTVSKTIYDNVDDSANNYEARVLENYEFHVDSTPTNNIVVSKKSAKKYKKKVEKKKVALKANMTPSKKTHILVKTKNTPKKKDDVGKKNKYVATSEKSGGKKKECPKIKIVPLVEDVE